eukprot:GILJ01007760.1.p1 GENE.GILJ01007760.1~~GILJ01007760.1.p1  ORF type:complete len:2640 (-),score=434.68 GILJ01007760.1:74-7498(-)
MEENLLLLRALRDVNVPKFLADDIPLFEGIISDLFPGIEKPTVDYGALLDCIKKTCQKHNLQPTQPFIAKVLQLHETTVVRHGLMLVGPTGGGKTSCLKVLSTALSMSESGHKKVHTHTLNPKSVTMGQLYGQFDEKTHEWTDGILPFLVRECVRQAETEEKQWVVFDGPVDALWVENMNTVLDDNKKLCLNSGEIITLTNHMNMVFEVEDLAVASPATVSRCGMVYLDPVALGLEPLFDSWLESLPTVFHSGHHTRLRSLFEKYVPPLLHTLRRHLKESVPTVDNNLVASLLKLLDCFFADYRPSEEDKEVREVEALELELEGLFLFCLIWSVTCTTDREGRKQFDTRLRELMRDHDSARPLPETGTIHDYFYDRNTNQWVGWLNVSQIVDIVTATTTSAETNQPVPFHEMVIPAVDTVRSIYLMNLLLTHDKHALCIGPTGTGKTVNINTLLLKGMKEVYQAVYVTFSARTSVNQTQDFLDSKMERRRKGVFGPPAGKKFILFVDDVNMPQRERYFAQPPIELLRQWMDYDGWYDRKGLAFRKIQDVTCVGAMGPPGGGRNPVTPRFLRHFNLIGITELDDDSMKVIFSTILNSFLRRFDSTDVFGIKDILVKATIEIYNTITAELLPTPSKSHYTYNLRDMAKVFQGILSGDPRRIVNVPNLLRLWIHENQRVFADRLVNVDDNKWFVQLLQKQLKKHFGIAWNEVVLHDRLLYGDFLNRTSDIRIYDEMKDQVELVKSVEEALEDYNSDSKQPMKLVMFMDAIEHLSRICRILRQPQGNALLLGVGGSGKQSLTKLAAYLNDFAVFQIEIVKGYGRNEWQEDLRHVLMIAGLERKNVVFLFSDTQIIEESMLEDVNNILNSGEVPNLFGAEEMDKIYHACKAETVRKNLLPTAMNVYNQFLLRVRQHIHVVVCLSPIGEVFRTRLRMFPSLVNCCTIDWFGEWPKQALISVAQTAMTETDLQLGNGLDPIIHMFSDIHKSVEHTSIAYRNALRRITYVTPTSYLELISTFKTLLNLKRLELNNLRNRLKIGLEKLLETANEVEIMQTQLREMKPQLQQTQKEVEEMMVQIEKDKADAAETKRTVSKEEREAEEKAAETRAIADDAQRDLDEALPALDEAVQCLSKLKMEQIREIRSMQKPPAGVKLCMQACCIMFNVKPIKKNDPSVPGSKVLDYWEASQKSLLNDPAKFTQMLLNYDKDNIPDSVIERIHPYIDREDFTPAAIRNSSQACEAICMWVRAMHKYYHVAKSIEPKKQRWREAQTSLDQTISRLNDAKSRLHGVEMKIMELEIAYNESLSRKEQLSKEVHECELKLERATKLMSGLGGEKDRWTEILEGQAVDMERVPGDCLISAATVAYSGAFTMEYRASLLQEWHTMLTDKTISHTPKCSVLSTIADPVKIRSWKIAGLPTDSVSIENGIIMDKARRWPLMIDPQGQANRWLKNMGRDAENGIDVIKFTENNFLKTLELAVQFGKWVLCENVKEKLDPAIEPILAQQTIKQGGSELMKIGEKLITYNSSFRFYMTSKLPNPHYTPEVSVKVTLLNFTITPSGLEDQLLGIVVGIERPDLEEKKSSLVISSARMRNELKSIEDKILFLLSNSQGDILDDEELINTLAASKKTSLEINEKVVEADNTERQIDQARESYRVVATRSSILYFCIADLNTVDPMYQYSMTWFVHLFSQAIRNAPNPEDLEGRLKSLIEYFTYSLYENVCRGLFEAHKLLFSFLLSTRVLQAMGHIDPMEWRFFLAGATDTSKMAAGRPVGVTAQWISDKMWNEISTLSELPVFNGLANTFEAYIEGFKRVFDSADAHVQPLPGRWDAKLSMFQKLLILRCLRPDKITAAVSDFIAHYMGRQYIEPPPFEISSSFKDSSVASPLIFILSPGSDPLADLHKFAEEMKMTRKMSSISLGQGQGRKAARLIDEASSKGGWVLLQNCHLAVSWMTELERLTEEFNAERVHKDFRLWLTSMPSEDFPVSILQNGIKMTNEPPKGLRANLIRTYLGFNDDMLNHSRDPAVFKKLLFGVSFFHAIMQERRKFGPIGWNIPYEYTWEDLQVCVRQLKIFLDESPTVPYKVLNYLIADINYGGRVTDAQDKVTIKVISKNYICPEILQSEYKFSESGIYCSVDADDQNSYLDYIKNLPISPEPEVFGLHQNAEMTCAESETRQMCETLLSLQPRQSMGAGSSREQIIEDVVNGTLERLPKLFDMAAVIQKYPTLYEESMNTVVVQECIKYNRLLSVMQTSLKELNKALKGLVVMSEELDKTASALFDNQVPAVWAAKGFLSLKPLASWTQELLDRIQFLQNWIDNGTPTVFWVSGFFFPQAFLTGTLQNFARKYKIPIDTLEFDYTILDDKSVDSITERPQDGCYIHGLYLEGARWDNKRHTLAESRPKELYTSVPLIWLLPRQNRKKPHIDIYDCPTYKVLSRRGTLSTTGHSTNFILSIELPTLYPPEKWVRAGVAMFTALRY